MSDFLSKGWVSWPIRNYRITALITILLLAFGLYGLYMMPKDEFPPFTLRQGVVVAIMPGATSEEIEAQVAKPLERYLFTFKEVNRHKTTSDSQNGLCILMVQLEDNVNNNDEVWSKIRHGINLFKKSLPKGVLDVIVNDNFGDVSALLITLESQTRSYRELQTYSDELSDRLRRIPSVSNILQKGEVKEQLTVTVDRERLAAYGIGPAAITHALSGQSLTTMAGAMDGRDQEIAIHVSPTQHSEEELLNQIIFNDKDKVIRIRDIATVKREYDMNKSFIENNGNQCVLLSLEMTEGYNIVKYGEEVEEVLEQFKSDYLPSDVQIRRITDQPQVVGKSVKDFLRDLMISMLIIVLVMIILFPLRSAIVAAITIPLSTFTSVGIMYAVDIPLNTVTLACLIVVLGMIVDNSIIVIDGYLEYLKTGMKRRDAAVKSAEQYIWPMALATACICAIFYPIVATMTGDGKDVLKDFPICVTINLGVSLIVAVAVIPLLNAFLIRKLPEKGDKKNITDYVQIAYEKTLRWNFRHPYLTMAIAVLSVIAGGLIFPHLKKRQFPYADRNQFAVEIYLPKGSSLSQTKSIANAIRDSLQGDPRVESVTSFIGCSSPRFQISYAPQFAGKNYAQLVVNTTDIETTNEVLDDYAPHLSNHWPEAYLKFKQMDFLTVPTYEYRFYGSDMDSIRAAAEQLMVIMRHMPELEWVHTDFDHPSPIMDIQLDPVASAQLGINRTTAQIQMALQTSSVPVGSIWEGDYEVPIVLKDVSADSLTFGDIPNTYLSTITGHSVPLRQVASAKPVWSETHIMHRNGERCISVTAEGKRNVLAAPIQEKLGKIIENMDLPQGVRAEIGGEVEKNLEIVPRITEGMILALVVIFFFFLFNFRRFGITAICMVSILLCIPGAMLGLVIANRTLGLTSLFGFITLMGIIMRNEILIFEHADEKVKEGMSPRDAAFDAGMRRMVPIFLTTATTAVGVIPMIIAGSSFWMLVGITIFSGGIGTLILVVTVLPVVYWKLSKEPKREEIAAPQVQRL